MTDRRLVSVARAFRHVILGRGLGRGPSRLMCFAVCLPLQGYLSVIGFETTLVEATLKHKHGKMNHFWLELPDGRILDPTADQFGLEPVYLGPVPYVGYSIDNAVCETPKVK